MKIRSKVDGGKNRFFFSTVSKARERREEKRRGENFFLSLSSSPSPQLVYNITIRHRRSEAFPSSKNPFFTSV